jgi:hypothetical protein
MRTTLTLDADVAAQIERLRASQGLGLKAVVNEALRRGLREMSRPAKRRRFETGVHDGGEPLVDITKVGEAVALAEGKTFR